MSKENLFNTILTGIVSLTVGLIFQITVSYFSAKTPGEIKASSPILIDSVSYSQTLIISNFGSKTIENLEFGLEKGKLKEVYSSNSLEYNKVSEDRFVIKKIYPRSNSSIQIVSQSTIKNYSPSLKPLNSEDYSLTFIEAQDIREIERFNWLSIIISALVYSVVISIVYYISHSVLDRMTNSLSNQLELAKKDAHVIRGELKIVQVTLAKMKLLLLTKIKDLNKENEYYRSLISELAKHNKNKIDDEKFSDLIRNTLKTYSTKRNLDKYEIETLDIIAQIIKSNENEKQNNN